MLNPQSLQGPAAVNATSAAIISQLPLDVVGGGERFTLETYRSALACGQTVDLWCAAAGHAPLDRHARRMSQAYSRLSLDSGTPVPVETVTLRNLLHYQGGYERVVIHQHLVNSSTLDMLSAAPPTQRIVLTSLGAEPIADLFAKAYEPHSGVEIIEISGYAAARSTARGMPASPLSAGVWRTDMMPPEPRSFSSELRAVGVGRLLPHKAFEIAIDAVAGLGNEATLAIIGPASGDAAYVRHLQSKVRRANNCQIVGYLDEQARRAALAQADVLLANSAHVTYTGKRLDQPELLGLVILEAVANGVLPIASDIPSFREICTKLGLERWLYPERDVDALRHLLRAVRDLSPFQRCRIVSEAAVRLGKGYLWDDYWRRLAGHGEVGRAALSRVA